MSCSFFLHLPISLESIAIKLSIMTQQGLSFPILVLKSKKKTEKKKNRKKCDFGLCVCRTENKGANWFFFSLEN